MGILQRQEMQFYLPEILKPFQKYLLDGEKVLLILALQLPPVWFVFYMNPNNLANL